MSNTNRVQMRPNEASWRKSLTAFLHFFRGVIVQPRVTFDALAAQPSLRWALMAVLVSTMLGWLNILLFAAFGYDWLGTRLQLANPTYVGFFGYLRVDTEYWVPIFAALLPLIGAMGMVIVPGLAQLLSRLWDGEGSFEQMVNTLTFAIIVPEIIIRSSSEILFGVPINLIGGNPRWWTAAMNGELGPTTAVIWNTFVIGVYTIGFDLWIIVLVTIAIRQVQRIPVWAAAWIAIVTYALWMYGIVATFVR